MRVSYRQIAKLLARGMPLDGQDYSDKIDEYINSLEAMPVKQQLVLKAAYIFSNLAPLEERQDLFQELVSHTLEVLSRHSSAIDDLEAFCYTVARHRRWDLWKQSKQRTKILNGGFISLNQPVQSDGEELELQDLIADDLDLESKLNSELDSQALLTSLPNKIKAIVVKRLNDQKPTNREYQMLARYREENEAAIRAQVRA